MTDGDLLLEEILKTPCRMGTVGQLAARLGWSVAKTHQVAQDCEHIVVNTAIRCGSGVGNIGRVSDYILEDV